MKVQDHIHERALCVAALEEGDEERLAALAHARTCDACARELREADALLRIIDAQPPPAPPSDEVLRRVAGSIVLDLSPRRRFALSLALVASAFTTNRFKAWYLSGALGVHLALATHAAVMLARGGPAFAWPWAGALVATVALPLRIGAYYVLRTPRTPARMLGLLGVSLAGLVAAVAAVASLGSLAAPSLAGSLPLVYAIAGFASSLYYVFVYSRLGRKESTKLAVGAALPSFELDDYEGRRVSSRRYEGSPVVYMFFRGNWCPLCMAQIREIAERYREIDRLGAKVVLVSPQPRENVRALSKRFGVPFDFLVDPDARAARALGIVHVGGLPAGLELFGYEKDTVLPTVVIVDRAGRILFSDQTDNYRVRPEPETFLSVLRRVPRPSGGAVGSA